MTIIIIIIKSEKIHSHETRKYTTPICGQILKLLPSYEKRMHFKS